MTLLELRAKHPHLFLANQDWFVGESFMQRDDPPLDKPPLAFAPEREPPPCDSLPSAVQLAELYVRHPVALIWGNYLWTCDTDRHGQRVFVGGVANRGYFEIHRFLHLTERFGVALWQ